MPIRAVSPNHYEKTKMRIPLTVSEIISIHYFEYNASFSFPGESHEFWEIVIADKGDLYLTAGDRELQLHPGDVFLHPPMQFHNIRTDGRTAPNSIIISFYCDCPALYAAADKCLRTTPTMRQALSAIIREAKVAFTTPLGDPYTGKLIRANGELPFGAEEVIQNYLELMLIDLIRGNSKEANQEMLNHKATANQSLKRVIAYFDAHIGENLTFEEICRNCALSSTTVKKIFRTTYGCGAMEYFINRKVERAKQFIREESLNFTEVSERLGFSSIHYFSKVFKSKTGMAPSEYARSVKALLENSNDQTDSGQS